MRVFFDTEFIENGRTIDLLSLGAVREDGEEFYAVSYEADLSKADPWVWTNVITHLPTREPEGRGAQIDITHPSVKSRSAIAEEFLYFAGKDPELWAYFADYDWVVLCQLYGRMIDLPAGWPMYCRDLKQLLDLLGLPKAGLPKQGEDEHHALADSRWVRDAFNSVRSILDLTFEVQV